MQRNLAHHFGKAIPRQLYAYFFLRCYVQRVGAALRQEFTFFEQLPMQRHVVGRAEELFVEHFYHALGLVDQRSPQVLVPVLHLVGMRIEGAVGADQAVAVEVVVGCGITAEVAAVSIYLFALCVMGANGLVGKVPDKAALQFGLAAYEFPVVLKSAF